MAKELLPDTIPWILKGLQDGDDDVRAVAAAALLPVAEDLGNYFQDEVSCPRFLRTSLYLNS